MALVNSDPAFVAKGISLCPFEDQTQQLLALREDVRATLNDHRLFEKIHAQLMNIGTTEQIVNEGTLTKILARSQIVHFVQSPILLFPSWRRQVGAIRTAGGSGVDRQTSFSGRKHSLASSRRGSPRAQRRKTSNMAHTSAAPFIDEEPCSLKIQYMLVEDYMAYLRLIGLQSLNIEKTDKSSFSPPAARRLTLASKNSEIDSSSLAKYLPGITMFPPSVWMYSAVAGGILLVHLTVAEPYFCVKIHLWSKSRLACELTQTRIQQQARPMETKELQELRELEHRKDELVRKCHVHSFTYDFHLRMVSRYLVGGKEVLFNPGFDTNAFLVDFLRYYGSRPPHARNAIYEENMNCTQLQVNSTQIWEFFLEEDNVKRYDWSVVQAANSNSFPNVSSDEFMLISRRHGLLNQPCRKYVRAVLNITKQPAAAAKVGNHQMLLKFYVIFVDECNTHPIMEGDFLSNIANKLGDSQQESGSGGSSGAGAGSSVGGEFTRVPPPELSPSCSTLVGGRESRMTPFSESDGDAEEEWHMPKENATLPGSDFIDNCAKKVLASRSTSLTQQYERPSVVPGHTLHTTGTIDMESSPGLADRRRFCSGGNTALYAGSRSLSNYAGAPLGSGVVAKTSLPIPTPKMSFSSQPEGDAVPISDLNTPRHPRRSSPTLSSALSSEPTMKVDDDETRKASAISSEIEAGALIFEDRTSLDQPDCSFGNSFKQYSIQRNPPRRHMQSVDEANISSGTEVHEGVLVPPESSTYLHYMSSHQKQLQRVLEEAVAASRDELSKFVVEADQHCHIDNLWRAMMTFKAPPSAKRPQSMFGASGSRDRTGDSNADQSSAQWKSMCTSELDAPNFEDLLRLVHVKSIVEEEPGLGELLSKVKIPSLFQFLVQRYSGVEKRCRYFETKQKVHMVITNQRIPDCVTVFTGDITGGIVDLLLVFKKGSSVVNGGVAGEPIRSVVSAIRSQLSLHFQEVINTTCAYFLSDLLHNQLKR